MIPLNSNKIRRLKKLPSFPGVYIFRDAKRRPLYIGKAANLKTRLYAYFRTESKHKPRIAKLIAEAISLQIIKTDSAIEALVQEASLIKRLRPKYNIIMRDDKNYLFVIITKEDFPRIILTHQPNTLHQKTEVVGPFTDAAALKSALKILRRAFPYCTCKKMHQGLCLGAELGKCLGVCCAKALPISKGRTQIINEYRQNIRTIVEILKGRKLADLKRQLKHKMVRAAQGTKYEKAAQLRNQLFDLEAIRLHRPVVHLEKKDNQERWKVLEIKIKTMLAAERTIARVEAYDISNLFGIAATGSMVVFMNGVSAKSEYRKFRIKTVQGANDVAMIAEIVDRRFRHKDWLSPDLIVLDGGKPQLSAALKALREFKIQDLKFRIPVVTALAKHDEELFIAGCKNPIKLKRQSREIMHFFQRVRDEAHRFAKNYHHKLRKRGLKNS